MENTQSNFEYFEPIHENLFTMEFLDIDKCAENLLKRYTIDPEVNIHDFTKIMKEHFEENLLATHVDFERSKLIITIRPQSAMCFSSLIGDDRQPLSCGNLLLTIFDRIGTRNEVFIFHDCQIINAQPTMYLSYDQSSERIVEYEVTYPRYSKSIRIGDYVVSTHFTHPSLRS